MRTINVERSTKETQIKLELNLDGYGNASVNTGIGFLDHMLEGFAKHGLFDLEVKVTGDLYVDCHHTVEDTGIVLGQAIKEALGDKKGIKRYGYSCIPMDEALVLCAVDLSGRAYLKFTADFINEKIGSLDSCMIKEFFQAVASNAQMNLHIRKLDGENDHHTAEAVFKSFAKALDEAVTVDERIQGVLSTKGTI